MIPSMGRSGFNRAGGVGAQPFRRMFEIHGEECLKTIARCCQTWVPARFSIGGKDPPRVRMDSFGVELQLNRV